MKKVLYIGSVILLAGLLGLLALDFPLLHHRSLTLTSPEGRPLSATYYPGSISKGVLLLEGFGSDQHMMRPLIRDLTASGLHVLTFDYSGHGYSPGVLEYDNASTDRLAGQVQTAMGEFQRLSGLDASQIVWMGHSLGARVALQSSVLGPVIPSRLVLLGAQVNLGTNAQSEFFTGTTDGDLAWVRSLGPGAPATPILLLTGTWEDILTVEGAKQLMAKLCGQEALSCSGEFSRKWVLFDALVHNYEIVSPRVITAARAWAFPEVAHPASLAALRIGLWFLVLSGVVLSLIGIRSLIPPASPEALNAGITISSPGKLVWGKLWLWLIALPLSMLVMFLYVLIPLPSPTFNLIYGGFLGGYGLLMFLLYRYGRMPGVSGKLRYYPAQQPPMRNGWIWALVFNLILFVSVTLLYRTGIGLAPPMGVRFAWVLIFTPLTALGLWLGLIEGDALAVAAPGRPVYGILCTLISLLPFYLYLLLLLTLGSISGMLSSIVGLLILLVSMFQGGVTRDLTGNAFIAAVIQAVFIFWLVLPAGALFPPFF